MKKFIGIIVAIIFLVAGCSGKESVSSVSISNRPAAKRTFIMVHLEAGYRACKTNNLPPGLTIPEEFRLKELGWQEYFWPTVIELVEEANEYGFKLTLAFNPQWGDFIARDSGRLSLITQWKTQGHEVAFHHHSKTHPDWNGYSNNPNDVTDPLYLGPVNNGFSFVHKLVAPGSVISSTLSGLPDDYPTLMDSPTIIFGEGNQYDSYPQLGPVKSLKPTKTEIPTRDIVYLTIREFSSVMDISLEEAFSILQEQYRNVKDDEVFGIVWHEFDYFRGKESYIRWFDFIKENGDSVKTMKTIAGDYFNVQVTKN